MGGEDDIIGMGKGGDNAKKQEEGPHHHPCQYQWIEHWEERTPWPEILEMPMNKAASFSHAPVPIDSFFMP